MKRPQPDIGDILRNEFITNLATLRKLLRYWGTETVNEVEILKQRQYYYPSSSRSANFEKLFTMLGAYNDVVEASKNMSGVDSAWIYFNKNKESDGELIGDDIITSSAENFVAHNLNLMWWDENDGDQPDNLTLTTSIVIEGVLTYTSDEGVTISPLLNPRWSKSTLISAIESNYDELWDTCLISQQGVGVINKGSFTDDITKVVTPDEDDLSPNDSWLQAISRYALRDIGIPCTIKDVSIGLSHTEDGNRYNTYVVTLEIPYIEFTESSAVVAAIAEDILKTYTINTRLKLAYPNEYYTRQAILSMSSSDLEIDDEEIITRPYLPWENATISGLESLWYNWGGYTREYSNGEGEISTYTFAGYWALRADVFRNPGNYGLTYKKLINYILPLIDSDYKKEKVPWYKKLVAVVIFAVIVIVAGVTGQWELAAVAAGVLAGSIVLVLLSLAAQAMGATEWASAFAYANKVVSPFVFVATIYLAWTGISNAYTAAQNAAQEAAKNAALAAGGAVTKVGVAETLIRLAQEVIGSLVDGIITGAADLTAMNFSNAALNFLSNTIRVFNTIQKIRLEELQDRIRDLKSENDKLLEEMASETDILQGFARISASPATADWSIFAGLYDLPYERGGGTLHIGNIQRTTKQALRKADYDDPVFKAMENRQLLIS